MTRTKPAKEAARQMLMKYIGSGWTPGGWFEYRNADASVAFYIARLNPPKGGDGERKKIFPIHEAAPGEFVLSMPKRSDAGYPLYRLSAVTDFPNARIFLVEGEPCADALTKLEIAAVTSVGGAHRPAATDFAPLRGRRVIILRDNDRDGLKYAHAVTAVLRKLKCEIQWVDVSAMGLSNKGDIVDWLKNNPTADTGAILGLPLIDPPPDTEPPAPEAAETYTLKPFSEIERRETRWLWFGQLSRGNVAILCGPPGVGKSKLSWKLAAITSTDGFFPGAKEPCAGGRVLILSAEDSPEETISQNLEVAGADLSKCAIIVEPDFDLDAGLNRLGRTLREQKDFALVILDPVSAYLGDTDENKNAEVRRLMRRVYEMAQESNVAILLISHPNKSSTQSALSRVSGSIAFAAVVRSAYAVEKNEEDPRLRRFHCLKNNLGDDTFSREYRIQTDWLKDGTAVGTIKWE